MKNKQRTFNDTSSVQSGWLPPFGHESLKIYYEIILEVDIEPEHKWVKPIQELYQWIKSNEVVDDLFNTAFRENKNIKDEYHHVQGVPVPRIKDTEHLMSAFNKVMKRAPYFINDALVGLPFSAIVVAIDPTLSGRTIFGLPEFNKKMSKVLNHWNKFLATKKSNTGFSVDGEQWLSETAKKQYEFDLWSRNEKLPYWDSWNDFFTREFKDIDKQRPIAGPDTNKIVISPNDGSLFRWRSNVAKNDVFWFKDMKYSIKDILSTSVEKDQKVLDHHKIVDIFEGGYVFQTYLNPYNYHKWQVPVNGKVLFDPIVVPGAFFNKLVIPDFSGATTASLPYLSQVNARGLIVFKTEDYGHVCCIPLGMSEVSTVKFDSKMKKGKQVSKGDPMGMFEYGGSSFVTIYEKLPDQMLIFKNERGELYPQNPPPAQSSAGTGSFPTEVRGQVGEWVPIIDVLLDMQDHIPDAF